jgi:hypothetical protein
MRAMRVARTRRRSSSKRKPPSLHTLGVLSSSLYRSSCPVVTWGLPETPLSRARTRALPCPEIPEMSRKVRKRPSCSSNRLCVRAAVDRENSAALLLLEPFPIEKTGREIGSGVASPNSFALTDCTLRAHRKSGLLIPIRSSTKRVSSRSHHTLQDVVAAFAGGWQTTSASTAQELSGCVRVRRSP